MTRPAIKATTSNSAGGFLVDAPLSAEIFKNIQNKSIVIPSMRQIPMASATLDISGIDEEPIVGWVASEGEDKDISTESIKQLTLTAQEAAVIVPVTEIMIEDSITDIMSMIREELEDGFVRLLEQSYLEYDATTPFAPTISGAVPAVNTIAFGTGADLVADFSAALQALEVNGFQDNIEWKTNPFVKGMIRDLRGTDGHPLFQPGNASSPDTFFGWPITYSRNFLRTGSPAAYEMIVGNWNWILEGIRNQLKIKVFDAGIVGNHNLIVQDKIAVRATARRAMAIRRSRDDLTNTLDEWCIAKVTGLI